MTYPCCRAVAACLLLVLLGLLSCLDVATARPAPVARTPQPQPSSDGATAWSSFKHLHDARRGSSVAGLAELKSYLARFGYVQQQPATSEHHDDDAFDEHLEAAVKRYQSRLSLPVTGRLDPATLGRIASPRCGIGDHVGGHGGLSVSLSESAAAGRFTFFHGRPRWTRLAEQDFLTLTYSISPSAAAAVPYLPPESVCAAIRSSFARWARVIHVEFFEINDEYGLEADINVGFYRGDHGDGDPFDGALGVLAHATGPNSGRVHFDAAERWTLDDADRETAAAVGIAPIDLESVATHEIGHVLGLGHSSSPNAIMYPSLDVGERKVDLSVDDVEGVQMLYGPNPDFRLIPSTSPPRSSWLAGSVSLLCVVLVTLITWWYL